MIQEAFLHYLWKFQKWTHTPLTTVDGQPITVFDQGFHNHDSGPDFEEARIKIGTLEWVGSVEIHTQSSDWNKHKHTSNSAYKNVILHVVYQHDTIIKMDNQPIPTLELKNHIDPLLIESYQNHIIKEEDIACGSQLGERMSVSYGAMLDRVLVERLERKAESVLRLLKLANSNWEETCYKVLASNFGFSVNKEAFELLAEHLPFTILKKNLHNPLQAEAIIFGQAGFLKEIKDDYQQQLKTEYEYLVNKYDLPSPLKKLHWKFGRMRPANFPSVRLSQLASLLIAHPKLFYLIIEECEPKKLIDNLQFEITDYWKRHYDFGKVRKRKSQIMGRSSFENLLINSVIPVLAAYSKYSDNTDFMNRAIGMLEVLNPEENRITKQWTTLNKAPQSAFESQAQIQLFKEYCLKRKCLSCTIGISLLNHD